MFYFSKSKHLNFAKLHQEFYNLTGLILPIKKRRRLRMIYKILKYFCLATCALFLFFLILSAAEIISLKQIYDQALSGKLNLDQAVVLAGRNDFSQAVVLAKAAENNFNFSLIRLEQFKKNYFINYSPYALSQLNQAQSLLVSVKFLSQAVVGAADFGQSLKALLSGEKKITFSKLNPEAKRGLIRKIFESAPELNGIKADLDLAYINLEQVKVSGILYLLNDKINQVKRQINEASLILKKAVPLSQLLPALAGYPGQADYLVVLPNNDELRPSGGFLGTYGILRIKDGEILSFNTDDIYHLDMPAQAKMNLETPLPIKKYLNDKWYLRDANWSPDWPTAAIKIDWFYRLETKLAGAANLPQAFNGVIAITPKLIIDFLRITGPVSVEGQIYDQNNFQDLLEYRVEKGFIELGVSRWQRKAVIGEIVKKLKIKIFDLPPDKWTKIINSAIDNLTAKNLMFYLADNHLENIAVENGWAGEIKNYYGDYLLVVDANLAALKTDAVMSRSLEYKVSQSVNGLFAKLILNYAHNGRPDWKTSAYKSYTRVYAPLGSQLIKINGYTSEQIDIGQEAGKTWFGFYFTVEPGKIKNLIIEYKLPPEVMLNNNYGLYLQKQPGKEFDYLAVDLSFKNGITSYNPASLSMRKVSPSRLRWEGDLNIDRIFEIKF